MMCKLGDLISIKHGYPFDGEDIVEDDNGVVLVTPGNFRIGGGFQEDKCKYFKGDYPDEYVLPEGALIVTMTDLSKQCDTLGYSAIIPKSNKIYLHNQRIGLVDIKSNLVSKDYLHWFMRTDYYQKKIALTSSGSNVHHTSPDRIYDVDIELPTIEVQSKITNTLSSLEYKIMLNNSICSDLESMAKLLYDYWFMQFDFPDENGRPYKSSGGKMVWNDELKREIPEGWNAKMIGDTDIYVSDYTANGSFKGLADNVKYNEGIPYAMLIRIVDFNNNFENVNNHIWIDKHGYDYLAKSNLHGDEIIICNVGAAGNVYRCPRFNHPMTLGPNGIVVNHEYLNNYLDLYFSSSIGQNQLHAISSGSIQLKFNKTNFRELYIPVPRKEIIDSFYMIYNPIFEKKCSVLKENQELASLRDFLLPMLMNGQIKIEDVKAS